MNNNNNNNNKMNIDTTRAFLEACQNGDLLNVQSLIINQKQK